MSPSGNGCDVSRYETWRALPVLAQHGHMFVRDYARSREFTPRLTQGALLEPYVARKSSAVRAIGLEPRKTLTSIYSMFTNVTPHPPFGATPY